MSCAVNKWKQVRTIFIFYQSAEDSQRIKLGIVFNIIASYTVYIFDSFDKILSLKRSRPKKKKKKVKTRIFSENAPEKHLF